LFGAFLLASASILLITSRQRFATMCLHACGAFLGIILCGSRYVFLGSLLFVVIVAMSHIVRQPTLKKKTARIVMAMAGVLVGGATMTAVLYADPENRISQLVTMVAEGQSPLENIGTLVWRRGIYDQTLSMLSHRGFKELSFGSGTSSGALAVLGWDRRYSEERIDANRVVHNEILRVTFEWGVVGLILFTAFVIGLIRLFLRLTTQDRIIPAYAFLALLPTVILGCCSENILAGSASPAGVGFLLSLTYGLSYARRYRSVAEGSYRPTVIQIETYAR
jgi:O-antigen ligase